MSLWSDPNYVRRQVALARRALARAKRTYGERSVAYAYKLSELRSTEQRLVDLEQMTKGA